MTTSLVELPNELLERILDSPGIELSTLYQLSTSSRRLQQICLAQYLRKASGNKPHETFNAVIPGSFKGHDAIAALNLSTSVTTIHRFVCSFPNETLSSATMRAHFNRTRRAISGLKSLQEAVFIFNPNQRLHPNPSVEEAHVYVQTFNDLLNACLQRGCTLIDIRGLDHLPILYNAQLVIPDAEGFLVSRFKSLLSKSVVSPNNGTPEPPNILRGSTWKYAPVWSFSPRPLDVLSTSPTPPSKLSTLAISNTYNLMVPPLLQWTYSTLQSAPLTTLSLENVKLHPMTEWPVVSAALTHAAPALTQLKLSRIRIGRKALALFIDGFPLLQIVSVDQINFPPMLIIHGRIRGPDEVEYRAPKDEFTHGFPRWTHLTELRIGKHWILDLEALLVKSILNMPALQSLIVILSDASHDVALKDAAQHDAPTRAVRSFLTQLDAALGKSELRAIVYLEMVVPQWIVPWMEMTTRSLSWVPPSVTGVVLVGTKGQPLLLSDSGGQRESVTTAIEKWFSQLFPKLRGFVMKSSEGDAEEEEKIEIFCGWKAMRQVFEKLQHVQVNGKRLDVGPH